MKYTFSKDTKTFKIFTALRNGDRLTQSEATKRFGVKNVSARIEELRKEGHCIYTNVKHLKDGRKITFYRLGTPTKAMVKAALSAGYSFTA